MSTNSTTTRCAACKYLRRRCGEDCVLAPYFPPTHPERFACIHRIFGASNVSRMLQRLPGHQRAQAAEAISSEAYWRVRDPVYGSVGVISMLQQEIHTVQRELAETQAQIAMYNAQLQTQQQPAEASYFEAQSSDHFGSDPGFACFYQPPDFP